MTKKVYRRCGDTRKRVRCLGPQDKEHWFWSANPTGERICARCRKMQENYSAAHECRVELPRR